MNNEEKKVDEIRKNVVELYNKTYRLLSHEFTNSAKVTYFRGYIAACHDVLGLIDGEMTQEKCALSDENLFRV